MTPHWPRFLFDPSEVRDARVRLSAAEAKHVRARRLRTGDTVTVIDGSGQSWVGSLEIRGERCEVILRDQLPYRDGESPLELTLAVGLLKGDKLDWVVEKATELGVARIVPFFSSNSLGNPSPNRLARWRSIAASAAKQCSRSVVPLVDPPIDLEEIISGDPTPRIFFCESRNDTAVGLESVARQPAITLIVGAEGGFSEEEAGSARLSGCSLVTLGPRILRAETAAIAAVALCQHLWGDLERARGAAKDRV